MDRSLNPYGSPKRKCKQLETISHASRCANVVKDSKNDPKWRKNAKSSDFWTFRKLGSPRSKSLKIEIWMFLDVYKGWLISKVCALGGFPILYENDIKYLLGVCALVRYGEICWTLVDFCSFACVRIRAKCVKTYQKIVFSGVALPRNCLQLKMGVERPVHMCGAVKIHQKLLIFHTRGRRFVYQIAKNASKIKNHDFGEIRMFVKCGGFSRIVESPPQMYPKRIPWAVSLIQSPGNVHLVHYVLACRSHFAIHECGQIRLQIT